MTGTVVLACPDAAYLFTDGLFQTAAGSPQTLRSKTYPLARMRAAVAFQGWASFAIGMASQLDLLGTLEEAVAAMPEMARNVVRDLTRTETAHHASLTLAGWPTDGAEPVCWYMGIVDIPGATAFTPVETTCFIAPGDDLPPDATEAALRDRPIDVGLALMRRMHTTYPELVGGFAQLTVVHRDAIETRILERW